MRYMVRKIAKRLGVDLTDDYNSSKSRAKDSTRVKEVVLDRKESEHKTIKKEKKKEVKVVRVESHRCIEEIKRVDKKLIMKGLREKLR